MNDATGSTIREIPPTYLPMMIAVLGEYDILEGDVAVMAGWIDVESAWNPWAVRYEPAFYERYTEPLDFSETEERTRALSWGLLQIMGQVAREFGFTDTYLPALCDPLVNLSLAAKILKNRHATTNSWIGALAAYNGGLGGNFHRPYRNQFYVDKVLESARSYGYQQGIS